MATSEASTSRSCRPSKTVIVSALFLCMTVELVYYSDYISSAATMLPPRWSTDLPLNLTLQHHNTNKNTSKFIAMPPKKNSTVSENSGMDQWSIPLLEKPASTERHVLTVEVNPWCRFGNRVFIFASFLGIATKNNMTVYLPPNAFNSLFNVFRLNVSRRLHVMRSNTEISFTLFNATEENCDHRLGSLSDLNVSVKLEGFLQCIKHFDGISTFLRQELQLKVNLQQRAIHILTGIALARNITRVGVHVRRGDLLLPKLQKNGLAVAPVGYLHRAMQRFRTLYSSVVFYVASDDMTWAKNNLRGVDVKFSSGASADEDFAVLVNCDHIVISSGTFGWWAAWLNGGSVVYYKGFPRPGSQMWRRMNISQYYYPSWIGMV